LRIYIVVILRATMGGQHWWECTLMATLLCYQVIIYLLWIWNRSQSTNSQ